MHRLGFIVAAISLAGCGEAVSAPPTDIHPISSAPAAPIAPPTVDLLSAGSVDLAVSSTTRSMRRGPALLIDGDFDTAWNSRPNDPAPAIEVRLSPEAEVTSIELTTGYTHREGEQDLFTANRRIVRVRVLRDGQEVITHSLDPEIRELQSIPVRGAGGVWRIEIAETIAGSTRSWTETCVSELRVLGHSSTHSNATRRFFIGDLASGIELTAIAAAQDSLSSPGDEFFYEIEPRLARMHLALDAYTVRCPLHNRSRERIGRLELRIANARQDEQRAQQELNNLACPGPPRSEAAHRALLENRAREGARETAAQDEIDSAETDLLEVVENWQLECERALGDDDEAYLLLERALEPVLSRGSTARHFNSLLLP